MTEHLQESDQGILRKVYIVGPETSAKAEMIHFLRTECNLESISKDIAATWAKIGAPFDESILRIIFEYVNIVIFLLTGEDQAYLRADFESNTTQQDPWLQPTQDKIFEAGYAFGQYDERVFLVRSGQVRPLSDIAGRYIYEFGDPEHKNALRHLLLQMTRSHTTGKRERRSPPLPQNDHASAVDNEDELHKRKRVFVIFGRNTFIAYEVRAFLRTIGLLPITWSQAQAYGGQVAGPPGRTLQTAFSRAWAVIVLLTGDDLILPTSQDTHSVNMSAPLSQPRANVLFEAGMAFGDPNLAKKTILVDFAFDHLELGKNLSSQHRLTLDNSLHKREEFIRKLRIAGCAVDLSNEKWYGKGNFYFAYKR